MKSITGIQSFKVIGNNHIQGNSIDITGDDKSKSQFFKSFLLEDEQEFSFQTGDSIRISTYVSGYYAQPVSLKIEGSTSVAFNFKENRVATEVVEVINPKTGKIWMDRNLGASQVANSSTDTNAYGDLYQWGRAADGHEKRTSDTTSTLSSSDTPGHGDFITSDDAPNDWRSPQNDDLWQGVNGTNNPCPSGYRLPTKAEWEAESQSWNSEDAAGAFASPLKLPLAGTRYKNGSLGGVGSDGFYWSSTVERIYSWYLLFHSFNARTTNFERASGLSVRCLKD